MKRLFQLVFFLTLASAGYAQYQPSYGQLMKPVAVNLAAPTDSRSYYYNTSGFNYTPFESKSQVLSWFANTTRRFGNYPIYIQEGSKINQYRFKNGTTDADLVRTDVKVDSVVYNATSRVMTIYLDDNTTVTTSLPDYALKTDSTQIKVDNEILVAYRLQSGIDSLAIKLPTVDVEPGTYPNPTITVDSLGRIVAVEEGSGGGDGSVTSVSVQTFPGISVEPSSITSSGTFAFTTTLNGVLKGDGSGFYAVSQIGNSDISDVDWSKISNAPQPTQSAVMYGSDSSFSVTNSSSYVSVSDTFRFPGNYFARVNRAKVLVYGMYTYGEDADSTGSAADTLILKLGSNQFYVLPRSTDKRIPSFKAEVDVFRKGDKLVAFADGYGKYFGTKDPIDEFHQDLQEYEDVDFSEVIPMVVQYKQGSVNQDRELSLYYFGVENSTTSVRNTPGTSPIIQVSTLSLTGFETSVGTASSYKTFTVSGNNLTANVAVSAPAGYEISTSSGSGYSGSLVITVSDGNPVGEPVTVYTRISSAATAGSHSGNISVSSSGASTVTIAVDGTVEALDPEITVSPNTLSDFSAVEGNYSSSQTFTVDGDNLTADVTVTAPSGYQVSKDNTNFSGSVSLTRSSGNLAGEPVTVYVRIKNDVAAGPVSGNISLTSSGADSKTVAVSGTVSSASTGVVAKFNFNATNQSVTGWVNASGNPHETVVTATDTRSGSSITVSSISNTTAHWKSFQQPPYGSSANTGGETAGNSKFPGAVTQSYWFNQNSATTTPNLRISGLVPGAEYTFEFMCSRLASQVGTANRYMRISCTTGTIENIDDYDVKGNLSETARTSSNTGGGIATFTKTADENGIVEFVICGRHPADGSHPYGYIGGLIVTKL